MIMTMTVLYKTKSGNEYPVEFGFTAAGVNHIVHEYEYITGLCRMGCKNYGQGGGCPPYAPKFEHIAGGYSFAVLVYARLHSQYKPQRVEASSNYYIHYRFQDIILSNLLHQIGSRIRKQIEDRLYYLGNGYCMGCGSWKCSLKQGENRCRFPEKRTYSLEATGIHVVKTLEELFDLELEWYNHNNYREIKYMTKAIGFFCVDEETREEVMDGLVDCGSPKTAITRSFIVNI